MSEVPGGERRGGTYLHWTGVEQTQDAFGRLAGELSDVRCREADLQIRLGPAECTAGSARRAHGGGKPPGSTGPQVLSEHALADVLAAVEASTEVNTKAAYRSDWSRFTRWAGDGGFPRLPAPPLVVAHYVTEAAEPDSPS